MDVDLQTRRAVVKTAIYNRWIVLSAFHTHTGVRTIWKEPEPKRDWVMTRIWSFSIDAVCVSVIFLVLSSLYMWYQLKQKRLLGSVLLGLSTLG